MARVHAIKDDHLTLALAERAERLWEAYLARDSHALNAFLADDYRAVHADGSIHTGKLSTEDFAAFPIEDYWLREFQAWPVGAEGAIATYTAQVEVRNGLHAERRHYAAGEVWMLHSGQWLCRYYHATPLK